MGTQTVTVITRKVKGGSGDLSFPSVPQVSELSESASELTALLQNKRRHPEGRTRASAFFSFE
jgi:hypothetical protein